MPRKKKRGFWSRKRRVWHNHFTPSILAGVAVAIVALFYGSSVPTLLLFASVGASAAILANNKSYHLTKLYSAIIAYFISIVVSVIIYFAKPLLSTALSVDLFLVVFLVSILMFLFDSFHPPAITAALSFMLSNSPLGTLAWLFLSIISLLIIVRFFSYLFFQNLSLKEFKKEFRRGFREELKEFK